MNRNVRSVTLLELIVSLMLLSVIVLALATIDTFSSFQVRSSERRATLQFELSTVLEHMTKQISQAIGSEIINGNNSVVSTANGVSVFVDSDGDGTRSAADNWINYNLSGNSLRYCSDCPNSACGNCNAGWETIASRITNFVPAKPSSPLASNFIDVSITNRWDPAAAASVDNPSINMATTIKMPSVTIN